MIDRAADFIWRIFSDMNAKQTVRELWAINTGYNMVYLSIAMLFFLLLEWIYRGESHSLNITNIKSKGLRHAIYYSIILAFVFLNSKQQDFIYFQF